MPVGGSPAAALVVQRGQHVVPAGAASADAPPGVADEGDDAGTHGPAAANGSVAGGGLGRWRR